MKKAISYKFIYTLGMILLVRLVAHIPVPWVDAELMQSDNLSDLSVFYFSSTKDSAIRSKPKRCKKNTYDNRRLSRFYKFVNYDFFS